MQTDSTLLEAALVGYQVQLDKVNKAIAAIRGSLGGRGVGNVPKSAGVTEEKKHRRTMSAAARKRIAAAQKKRWAEFHRRKNQNG